MEAGSSLRTMSHLFLAAVGAWEKSPNSEYELPTVGGGGRAKGAISSSPWRLSQAVHKDRGTPRGDTQLVTPSLYFSWGPHCVQHKAQPQVLDSSPWHPLLAPWSFATT